VWFQGVAYPSTFVLTNPIVGLRKIRILGISTTPLPLAHLQSQYGLESCDHTGTSCDWCVSMCYVCCKPFWLIGPRTFSRIHTHYGSPQSLASQWDGLIHKSCFFCIVFYLCSNCLSRHAMRRLYTSALFGSLWTCLICDVMAMVHGNFFEWCMFHESICNVNHPLASLHVLLGRFDFFEPFESFTCKYVHCNQNSYLVNTASSASCIVIVCINHLRCTLSTLRASTMEVHACHYHYILVSICL